MIMNPVKHGVINKSESYIFAIESNSMPISLNSYQNNNEFEGTTLNYDKEVPIILINKKPLLPDQIEYYRSEISWKRIRWLFYMVFWFSWVFSLLCGIILTALHPKCTLSDRDWWKDTIIYEIWTLSYRDSDGDGTGDLNGIVERMGHLRKIGIGSLFLRPIIKVESSGLGVINHTELSSQIGSFNDFSNLVKNAHEKGMRILIDFMPIVSSIAHPWYERSALASRPENSHYADFYFWRRNIPTSEYISAYANSTLKYFHVRSRPDLPVLSWRNNNVSEAINSALSFWIQNGVDGFHLSSIEYLHRTLDGKQPDWKEITKILYSLRKHIQEQKSLYFDDEIFLFTSCEHLSEKTKRLLTEEGGINAIINTELRKLEIGNKICPKSTSSISECVNDVLSDLLLFHQNYGQSVWPIWTYGSTFTSRLVSRINSKAIAELLILLELVLPGTPLIYYGEEIGLADSKKCRYPQRGPFSLAFNDSQSESLTERHQISRLRNFMRMVRYRQRSNTLATGKTYITKLMGQSFALCRYLTETDENGTDELIRGDIVVYVANFGQTDQILPLNDLPPFHMRWIFKKGKIVAHNVNSKDFPINSEIDLRNREIRLGPTQGIVFQASTG